MIASIPGRRLKEPGVEVITLGNLNIDSSLKEIEGAKPCVARPPKTTKQTKQQRSSNSSARPHTPQQPQDKYQPQPVNLLKKRSPIHPELAPCLSPHHSNKSSPASTSGRGPSGQGYNFYSLGQPLSSSDSSSDSGSYSEADDTPAPPKVALPSPKTSWPGQAILQILNSSGNSPV